MSTIKLSKNFPFLHIKSLIQKTNDQNKISSLKLKLIAS